MPNNKTTGRPAEEDVYWCMADIGWITGHSYIVYGLLALGASSVIYEGTPTHPDAGRPWRIAEDLHVDIFYTSPTAVRALHRAGPNEPLKYNYRFKHMTTVGEPIEPELWRWYHTVVGKGSAVIVDTWWQTETRGFLCTTVPVIHKMKPGRAGPGLPSIDPVIYDDEGKEISAGANIAGDLCIRNPWPGTIQIIWRDPERFVGQYYARYCRDTKSKDWHDWPCNGRRRDAGRRRLLPHLGTPRRRNQCCGPQTRHQGGQSAALIVPAVAEAAVVPVTVPIKGKVPDVYVSLKPTAMPSREIANEVSAAVVSEIGSIARPHEVSIVPDMPKTRSFKIMRRVLAAISNHRDPGDVPTLANPEIVERIREAIR